MRRSLVARIHHVPSNCRMSMAICAFPAPTSTDGELIALEKDHDALRILHRRVDRLPRDVLIDCALKAGEDVGDIRDYLHEAVDELLGSFTGVLTAIPCAGRTWLATGGDDSALEPSFWFAVALATSGITDAPLRGDRISERDFALEQLNEVLPAFLAELVRRAGSHANVSPSTLDAIVLKLDAEIKMAEYELQAVVRRGLRRARFGGIIFGDVYIDEDP